MTDFVASVAAAGLLFLIANASAAGLPRDDAAHAGQSLASGAFNVEVDANDVVSVDARYARIDALVAEIADQSGLHVIRSGPLDQQVSLRFREVSLAGALQRILSGHDFALRYLEPASRGNPGQAGTLWILSKGAVDAPANGVSGHPSPSPSTQGEPFQDGLDLQPRERLERLGLALSDDDPAMRVEAVHALVDVDNDQARGMLASALGDPDPWVRQEAAAAMGVSPGPAEIHMLRQGVQDADPEVRQAAIEALVNADGETSVGTLSVALHDPDPAIRAQTVQVLSELDGATAVRLVAGALDDGNHEVRREAVIALGLIGGSQAGEMLEAAVNDPRVDVRREAVWALAGLDGEADKARLRQALDDPDSIVRESARKALTE